MNLLQVLCNRWGWGGIQGDGGKDEDACFCTLQDELFVFQKVAFAGYDLFLNGEGKRGCYAGLSGMQKDMPRVSDQWRKIGIRAEIAKGE